MGTVVHGGTGRRVGWSRRPAFRGVCWAMVACLAVGTAAGTVGCQPRQPETLRLGYEALNNRDFDRALQLADEEIRRSPTGPDAAGAYYLRGRALEQRAATTPEESARRWAMARAAYTQALALDPSPRLRAYIRASLGNVAFFQDDYATAAEMFRMAYGELDNDDSRAWALYRAGLSYQRLGRFDDADRFFTEVMRRYPGTLQARRAEENRGARAFFVRLATFHDAPRVEAAAAELRRQGFTGISTIRDSRGLFILRIGPYATYANARDARLQLQSRFPDALIMP